MLTSPPAAIRRERRSVGRFDAVPVAGSVVVAGAVGWTTSFPGAPFVGLAVVGVGCCLLAALWITRAHRAAGLTPAAVASVVVLIATVVGSVAELPLQARFALAADDLDAAVAGLPDPTSHSASDPDANPFGTFPGDCPTRVGVTQVLGCRSFEGGYQFLQRPNAISDDAGYVYLPGGPPLDAPEGYRHLAGDWYTWRLEPLAP